MNDDKYWWSVDVVVYGPAFELNLNVILKYRQAYKSSWL